MKTKHVKDLMVPISDYATVDENASMAEAIRALLPPQLLDLHRARGFELNE